MRNNWKKLTGTHPAEPRGQAYLFETVFVIPAEAGIGVFHSGPLLPAFAGKSLHLRKQVQG